MKVREALGKMAEIDKIDNTANKEKGTESDSVKNQSVHRQTPASNTELSSNVSQGAEI